jgi:hypothetical protein
MSFSIAARRTASSKGTPDAGNAVPAWPKAVRTNKKNAGKKAVMRRLDMSEYIVFWDMIKPVLLLSALLFYGLRQDVKMATWSIGKPDTESYESLSFWIKENHRAYVRYAHGRGEGDTELQWMGSDSVNGRKAFRVSIPQSGACCWVIAPDSAGIRVMDRRTNSTRIFFWEDGNPAGDSTISCSICAQDEQEAQGWLRKYFFH